MKGIAVLLLGSLYFASCSNCNSRTHGYIADEASNKGIDSVKIHSYGALDGKVRDERTVYTDSNSYFETYFASKGTAKCPVLKLEITKDGYYPLVTADIVPGDTIFLKKIEQ